MSRFGDIALGGCGVGLAALAAWFPWHVYLSPQSYGPPRMAFERVGDPVAEHLASLDLLLEPSPKTASLDPFAGIDRTVTGSISDSKSSDRIAVRPEIVFAVPGRALVRHGGELMLWQAGSRLGDGRSVHSIVETSAGIEIVLSDETRLVQARSKVEGAVSASRK